LLLFERYWERRLLIGYARVSTSHQDTALQIDALKATGCERTFEETASGAQRDRPQLKEALGYMREGDILVCYRMDRVARSLRQLIETVEDLEARGIGFKSLNEQIDTTSAGGKLVFHIFGALSEFEKSLISSRTMAGLEAARARGRVGGRPKALDDDKLAVAKTLLANSDLTVNAVAKQIGSSPATLYRYLPAARAEAKGY
jgi:DNA invertase Pin-like site-specific DNA recombinase